MRRLRHFGLCIIALLLFGISSPPTKGEAAQKVILRLPPPAPAQPQLPHPPTASTEAEQAPSRSVVPTAPAPMAPPSAASQIMQKHGLALPPGSLITPEHEAARLDLTDMAGRDEKGLWFIVGQNQRARPKGAWLFHSFHPDGNFYVIQKADPLMDKRGQDKRPTPLNLIVFKANAKDQPIEGVPFFAPNGAVMITDRPDYVKGGRALVAWQRKGESFVFADRKFVPKAEGRGALENIAWSEGTGAELAFAGTAHYSLCLAGHGQKPRFRKCP